MKTSDVSRTVFIFVAYFFLFFSTILAVGVNNINDQWATYRCNPLVMPFAGLLGHDASENFDYCTSTIQETSLNNMLAPLNQQMNQMQQSSDTNKKASRNVVKKQNSLLSAISTFSGGLIALSTNMSTEMKRNSNSINTVLKKMSATVTLFERTVDGITKTAQSVKHTAQRIPGFKK